MTLMITTSPTMPPTIAPRMMYAMELETPEEVPVVSPESVCVLESPPVEGLVARLI